MKYNYRVYGCTTKGYDLITITKSEEKALKLSEDVHYTKILVIRHNLDLDMDEPYLLTFPREEKDKVKKKVR